MTRLEQKRIIREICHTLRDRMFVANIPDHWDGIELRQLACDLTHETVGNLPLKGARLTAYKNERIMRNI